MYRLQVIQHIESAHWIVDHPGKCKNVHGHRWNVEAVLEGSKLDHMNMIADFSEVKACMSVVLGPLDHTILNQAIDEVNMTAEVLSKHIYKELEKVIEDRMPHLKRRGVKLARVTVWESPECCLKYFETKRGKQDDDKSS